MGSAPSALSMVSVTSARPSGGREAVPAKTMFDLPDPFGPTTQVIPGSNRSDVADAKDLNPRRVRLFTYTRGLSSPSGHSPARIRSWPLWPAKTAGAPSRPASPAPYRAPPSVPVIRAHPAPRAVLLHPEGDQVRTVSPAVRPDSGRPAVCAPPAAGAL